jgi:ABC-type proline/glycine betaine transport system permease subunit
MTTPRFIPSCCFFLVALATVGVWSHDNAAASFLHAAPSWLHWPWVVVALATVGVWSHDNTSLHSFMLLLLVALATVGVWSHDNTSLHSFMLLLPGCTGHGWCLVP